jgi:hypothetical protein
MMALSACNLLTGVGTLQLSSDEGGGALASGPISRAPDGGGAADTPSKPADAGSGAPTPSPTPDAGTPPSSSPTFVDAFQRPDSKEISNGWIAKTPGAFVIQSGAVVQLMAGDFDNLYVYRPTSEDVVDTDLSIDVVYPAPTNNNVADQPDPGLYARIQVASSTAGSLNAYSFYLYDARTLCIERDPLSTSSDYCNLALAALGQPVSVGSTVHLDFRVSGTNPVQLVGTAAMADGTVLGSTSASDSSAQRIQAAGSVGFGSGFAKNAQYRTFKRITDP